LKEARLELQSCEASAFSFPHPKAVEFSLLADFSFYCFFDGSQNSIPKCIRILKKRRSSAGDKSQHLIQFKKFYFIPFLAPLPTFGCACKYFKLSPQIQTLPSLSLTHTRARGFPDCFFIRVLPSTLFSPGLTCRHISWPGWVARIITPLFITHSII